MDTQTTEAGEIFQAVLIQDCANILQYIYTQPGLDIQHPPWQRFVAYQLHLAVHVCMISCGAMYLLFKRCMLRGCSYSDTSLTVSCSAVISINRLVGFQVWHAQGA